MYLRHNSENGGQIIIPYVNLPAKVASVYSVLKVKSEQEASRFIARAATPVHRSKPHDSWGNEQPCVLNNCTCEMKRTVHLELQGSFPLLPYLRIALANTTFRGTSIDIITS